MYVLQIPYLHRITKGASFHHPFSVVARRLAAVASQESSYLVKFSDDTVLLSILQSPVCESSILSGCVIKI